MDIFKNRPEQWGLRGDPEFWDTLSKEFENLDKMKNEETFGEILDDKFNKLLMKGKRISNEIVWFEEFSQLGMSGGAVSVEWWTNMGLPLLKKRYSESQ